MNANAMFDAKVEDIHIESTDERYVFRVAVCEYDDGGYTVIIPTLPGVVSEGDTYVEAIANIRDAFREAVAVFTAGGNQVPWKTDDNEEWRTDMKEAGVCEIKIKWLSVNV